MLLLLGSEASPSCGLWGAACLPVASLLLNSNSMLWQVFIVVVLPKQPMRCCNEEQEAKLRVWKSHPHSGSTSIPRTPSGFGIYDTKCDGATQDLSICALVAHSQLISSKMWRCLEDMGFWYLTSFGMHICFAHHLFRSTPRQESPVKLIASPGLDLHGVEESAIGRPVPCWASGIADLNIRTRL